MFAAHSLASKRKCRLRLPALLLCLASSLPALVLAEETMTNNAMPTSAVKPTSVARAIFTTAIVDREPVDDLVTLENGTQRVYFFSDLRGLAGRLITHRWEYNGKTMAEVTFKVGNGARWRVYSSKNLLPEWTGLWKVVISNDDGNPIKTSQFEYTTSAPSTP